MDRAETPDKIVPFGYDLVQLTDGDEEMNKNIDSYIISALTREDLIEVAEINDILYETKEVNYVMLFVIATLLVSK